MLETIRTFFSGLSQKEKKMLYVSVILLTMMLFDRLVISPISSETSAVKEEITEKLSLTRKNIRLLGYKERILEEDDRYSSYYTRQGLSREVTIATFLGDVENMAKNSGIALNNIDPVRESQRKGYTEFSLELECQGKMSEVFEFLYKIDVSEKPMRVESFQIAVRNRDNNEVRASVTVTKMIKTRAEMAGSPAVREEGILTLTERVIAEGEI